jgi:hypothetical protein
LNCVTSGIHTRMNPSYHREPAQVHGRFLLQRSYRPSTGSTINVRSITGATPRRRRRWPPRWVGGQDSALSHSEWCCTVTPTARSLRSCSMVSRTEKKALGCRIWQQQVAGAGWVWRARRPAWVGGSRTAETCGQEKEQRSSPHPTQRSRNLQATETCARVWQSVSYQSYHDGLAVKVKLTMNGVHLYLTSFGILTWWLGCYSLLFG